MKKLSLIYFIFLISIGSFSQNSPTKTTFWKLTSLGGELNLDSFYWDQETERNDSFESLQNSYLSGGIFLNSQSYFWHPNFLSLDLDVGYSPETGQYLSLVTPDHNEVNTTKKIDLRAYLFKQNSLNLSVFTNYNESYNNRENLTNLKSKYFNWGSVFSYTNKYLPISVSYNSGKGEQTELQTERSYVTEHQNLEARANKSFSSKDYNEFIFSHNKYTFDETILLSDNNYFNQIIKNDITSWSLNNNLFFDRNKNYSFNSRVSNLNQKGDFNYKRFEILENIHLKLPKKFNFSVNYNYFDINGDMQNSKQNDIRGSLSHQLYNSLRTNVFYEYHTVVGDQYEESVNRMGIDLNYTKKIPLNGVLSLNYGINTNLQDRKSDDAFLHVEREPQRLTDNQIVVLDSQNIDATTVIVNDVTGTIIYRLNFDYLLIQRNELLEIQRIPGGQIANNETVYVDYTAIQPTSYNYKAINNYFSAAISLFKNTIEFYYKFSKQDFIDPENVDLFTLEYFNRNIYGTRFRFYFITGGIEKDNYESTVIPYRLTRYYIILQGNIKNKLTYTINGDIRDYSMIVEEGMTQEYSNISGSISYNIGYKTKLSLESSYIKQLGEGVDLDLITSRLRLSTRYRQLYISTGIELYKSELFNEKMDFKKISIHLSRKF